MAESDTDAGQSHSRKPLRLWPGVVILGLLVLARFVIPAILPDLLMYSMMGSMAAALAVVVWWVFFSRAPWSERLGALALMVVGVLVTPYVLHESIRTGAMGMLYYILVVPVLGIAFVVWAVATRNLSDGIRRVTMAGTILAACGVWALLRTGGFTGQGESDFAWRWSQTPEEQLVANTSDELTADQAVPQAENIVADWPGFRGPDRNDVVHGVRIETDWVSSPPVELWRKPIGPGWSSFAVGGDFLYTQEQRGDNEDVACYNLTTGEPVWKHSDATRFWESNAGAGPRATPTLKDGRVYTLGATGILNALDAHDGTAVWSRNAASDTKAKLPGWGFAGSPLVIDDLVVAATSGALVAYDVTTGEPRWFGPAAGEGYSSPHLVTIDDVVQILQLNGDGVVAVAPADGTLLWEHQWSGYPIVQPALTADGDVLISVTDHSGIRRLGVTHGPGGWTAEERWTSNRLKPYYSDFVVHNGHAFGFDGSILACIDLNDGQRKWKGGRYGAGQIFVLAEQDLLLVLSEQGELALVKASPDQFSELARFPAVESKTWNHPVLVGDILLVRNGQEMAAFRLALLPAS